MFVELYQQEPIKDRIVVHHYSNHNITYLTLKKKARTFTSSRA